MNEKDLDRKGRKILELSGEVRRRYGCDYCKKTSIPTEKFIGYNHTVLWVCTKCIKKLQSWAEKEAKKQAGEKNE